MGIGDIAKGVFGGGIFSKSGRRVLFGDPEQNYQQSLLSKEQQPLHEQLVNAGMNEGAGGAFGTSADYYRNLLSDDSADFNAFAAPELRRFNEDIIPGLSEQFAGMGSGGLSSSGFRNAAVNAGTDLSERLGAIRANLRSQAAQGLFNVGQAGLNPVVENIHRPATGGLVGAAAQALPSVAAAYFGAPAIPTGGATPNIAPPLTSGAPKAGSTSPYGGGNVSGKYNLPTFMGR